MIYQEGFHDLSSGIPCFIRRDSPFLRCVEETVLLPILLWRGSFLGVGCYSSGTDPSVFIAVSLLISS